jgi:hypothetical protein
MTGLFEIVVMVWMLSAPVALAGIGGFDPDAINSRRRREEQLVSIQPVVPTNKSRRTAR